MNNRYVTKGVTFNVNDPDQYKLLDHALKRKNFSSYIKRLIQRDMENQVKIKTTPKIKNITNTHSDIDDNLMDQMLK